MAFESHRSNTRLVFGLFAIVAGTVFLLHNQGILHVEGLWRFWPVIFFLVGITKALEPKHRDKVASVGVMFLFGTAFLLINFRYLTWGQVWPLGLIALGLLLLWRAFQARGEKRFVGRSERKRDGSAQWSAVFSAIEKEVSTGEFREGEANTVFGSIEVDLRHAKMVGDKAYMNVNVVFGSVEMRVPECWKVEVLASAVFGSCEDRTRPSLPGDGLKTLVVRGDIVFGSVEIEN